MCIRDRGKSGSYFIFELVNLSPLFFNPFSFFLQKRGRNIIKLITVFSKLLGGGAVVQCIGHRASDLKAKALFPWTRKFTPCSLHSGG